MSAVGPGDLVECIESLGVNTGKVFTVRVVTPEDGRPCPCHGTVQFGLLLVDMPDPPTPGECWCGACFRPAGRRAEALIRTLLTPTPELEMA